ncbi:MAG: hypothetical protein NVS9B13_08390 [Candidatus Acidiferrum sp.]
MKAAAKPGAPALLIFLLSAGLTIMSSASDQGRVNLFPRLRAGERYAYQVRYQAEKKIKTESAVAAPMAPEGGRTDAQRLFRLDVIAEKGEGRAAILRVRIRLVSAEEPESEKVLELTLHGDGRVSDEQGMDALSAEDQVILRVWIGQFGMAGIFPAGGVKPGDKWKSAEPVSGAALEGLDWLKEFTYVRNEVCPVDSRGAEPAKKNSFGKLQQMCAVILTTETLKQKSSPERATPDDFKSHDLRTAGTAHGTNEIVSYIALDKGLLMRGTEEAQQAMDVEVALANRGNRVHYNVDARSHTEILIVEDGQTKSE